MDRDGVINEEVDYLHRLADLRLLPRVAEAVRAINASGYLAIVVTNQSVVARNLCSIQYLGKIHRKLEALLEAEGARLDAIYLCPHHPATGDPRANRHYEIECDCRKPKTGLIQQAQRDFDINLGASFMVGDSWRDVACGKAAGVTTIVVKTGHDWRALKEEPDYLVGDLREAVALILRRGRRGRKAMAAKRHRKHKT